MISFHGDSKIKKTYLDRVVAHRKADDILTGIYWNGEKGCAVGCTIHGSNHKAYESELGIPEWLARVEDTLFEGMSIEKSKTWPEKFLKSIPLGVDLEPAKGKFLVMVLERVLTKFDHNKFPEVKSSIDRVIHLWKSGGTEKEFEAAAARAAWAWAWARGAAGEAARAARAAWAAAAGEADRAAARAGGAAGEADRAAEYDYFADELIKILKACK